MMLADAAYYALALALTNGNKMAVTSSFHIDFVRKPAAEQDLVALATLIKSGKRLIVMHVHVWSVPQNQEYVDGGSGVAFAQDALVAFGSGTYAVPSRSNL